MFCDNSESGVVAILLRFEEGESEGEFATDDPAKGVDGKVPCLEGDGRGGAVTLAS